MSIFKESNCTHVTLTFKIPYGTNRNGSSLTKDAIEDAMANFGPVPIVGDNSTILGLAGRPLYDNAENVVEWDDKNQQCRITIRGVLYNANAEIYPREIVDGKITRAEIVGIGLNEIKEN